MRKLKASFYVVPFLLQRLITFCCQTKVKNNPFVHSAPQPPGPTSPYSHYDGEVPIYLPIAYYLYLVYMIYSMVLFSPEYAAVGVFER